MASRACRIDLATPAVGAVTVVLIVALQRTRLKTLGLVAAVIIGSALAAGFNALGADVQVVADIADVPRFLPLPTMPVFGEMFGFIIPARARATSSPGCFRACRWGARCRPAP